MSWLFVFAMIIASLVQLGTSSIASAESDVSSQSLDLRAQSKQLRKQSSILQNEALRAHEVIESVAKERDAALSALTHHLVAAYRHGERTPIENILASRDVDEIMTRARLTYDITSFEFNMVRNLDAAEVALRESIEDEDALLEEAARLSEEADSLDKKVQIIERQRTRVANKERRKAVKRRSTSSATTLVGNPTKNSSSTALKGVRIPSTGFYGVMNVGNAGGVNGRMIDSFLASHGSPMAGNGVFFELSGRRWGIDPRLIVAIAGAESSFGQITCGDYNAWGWSCPNSPVQFTSWAHGIDTIAEGLRRYYLDEGYLSVAQIQTKYAPSGASNDPTGLNNHWVGNVTEYLVAMGGNPEQLLTGPAVAALADEESSAQ